MPTQNLQDFVFLAKGIMVVHVRVVGDGKALDAGARAIPKYAITAVWWRLVNVVCIRN